MRLSPTPGGQVHKAGASSLTHVQMGPRSHLCSWGVSTHKTLMSLANSERSETRVLRAPVFYFPLRCWSPSTFINLQTQHGRAERLQSSSLHWPVPQRWQCSSVPHKHSSASGPSLSRRRDGAKDAASLPALLVILVWLKWKHH